MTPEWKYLEAKQRGLANIYDGSVAFYEKFGFVAFQDISSKLFMTMVDLRASLVDTM